MSDNYRAYSKIVTNSGLHSILDILVALCIIQNVNTGNERGICNIVEALSRR